MAFESFEDAERVRAVLAKRLGRYGLESHADKTRFIDFRKHIGLDGDPYYASPFFQTIGGLVPSRTPDTPSC